MADDAELRSRLYEKLEQSGELKEIKQLVMERLRQSGWEEELKQKCKELIRQRGIENITLDSLIHDVSPLAKASVPSSVKSEAMEKIRGFVERNA